MKAYRVQTRGNSQGDQLVEEIEVDCFTGNYHMMLKNTLHTVFENRLEAIDYAKRITLVDIARIESELGKLQARLATIEAMEGAV